MMQLPAGKYCANNDSKGSSVQHRFHKDGQLLSHEQKSGRCPAGGVTEPRSLGCVRKLPEDTRCYSQTSK